MFLWCACLCIAGAWSCTNKGHATISQEAYVWQRAWTPAVTDAVRHAPVALSGLRVLVGESSALRQWRTVSPDTVSLLATGTGLTAVFRIDGNTGLSNAQRIVGHVTSSLTRSGGRWRRVEIDYDCPTRMLGIYAQLLKQLRAELPTGIELSITALPTWMTSSQLPELLGQVDQSVLQVHSVADPHQGLFNPDQASTWIRRYARISDKPFMVALPNYGSRLSWDTAGNLQSVISETDDVSPPGPAQELEADPAAVAHLMQSLRTDPPGTLRGIVWFRLPVAGDRRIWSNTTWQRVMSGQSLSSHLQVESQPDAEGANQVQLANDGSVDGRLPALVLAAGKCLDADGGALYAIEHTSASTVWRLRTQASLRVGQVVRVGWTRCPVNPETVHLEY